MSLIADPQRLLDGLKSPFQHVEIPTVETLTSFITELFRNAGAVGHSIIQLIRGIDPNWDLRVFPEILAKYLLGKLTIVINGVSVVFASKAFMHQGLAASKGFTTVTEAIWTLILKYIYELLKDLVVYIFGGAWCIIATAICSGASGITGGYLVNYKTCMTYMGCSSVTTGGGLIKYSSIESKQINITIDKLMWVSIVIEVDSKINPLNRSMNKKILKEIYRTGGVLYELTLIPELNIGFEYREHPLLFPENKKNTFLLTNATTRNNRKHKRNKTKRN
jgi:hypothetical protein